MNSTSWFRRNAWYFKGKREYTKSAFEFASSRFGEKDLDVECSDRHYMITGGNSKIGLSTALEIARRGGILHLVCRNATAMKEARSHIITTTGNDRIYQHQVNLAEPKEVAHWAEEFLKTYNFLDVVIHNASCMALDREESDGQNTEANFTVNSLAVHIITITLLPLLQRSPDPRVITVTNAGMLTVKLDPQDINFEVMHPFDGRMAYLHTRRQQMVMNFCYAQRFERIKFFSMHPGWVDTPVTKSLLQTSHETMKDNLRTPAQGADTIIWLAISQQALKHSSGLFFQDRVPVPTHLPLAWTRSSAADEQLFMSRLDEHLLKFVNPELFQKSTEPPSELQRNSDHKISSENLLSEENAPHHLVPVAAAQIVEEDYYPQEELKLRVDKIANIIESQERNAEESHSTQDQMAIIEDNTQNYTRAEDGTWNTVHSTEQVEVKQENLSHILQDDSTSNTDHSIETLQDAGTVADNTEHLNATEESGLRGKDPSHDTDVANNKEHLNANKELCSRDNDSEQLDVIVVDNSEHLNATKESGIRDNNPVQLDVILVDNSEHLDATGELGKRDNDPAQLDAIVVDNSEHLNETKESGIRYNDPAQLDADVADNREHFDATGELGKRDNDPAQLNADNREHLDATKESGIKDNDPGQLDAIVVDNSEHIDATEDSCVRDKDSTQILSVDESSRELENESCTGRQ